MFDSYSFICSLIFVKYFYVDREIKCSFMVPWGERVVCTLGKINKGASKRGAHFV